MDRTLIDRYIAEGLVREQRHQRLPLSVFNYSDRVQFERLWDDITRNCRGLVMHGDRIVARPFAKFFNDSEHAEGEIPWHLPCEITEKMDGSLLIWFHFAGQWLAATRGSFHSEQAAEGKLILEEHYRDAEFDPAITYLFEVIFPSNRVVVDYGDTRDVVLLGMIETATGREIPREQASKQLRHVRALPPSADARALRTIIRDDQEGYVIRFANGFRIKVKGERYLELHKILCGISNRIVWEYLSSDKPFADLLALVPDEFADWVRAEQRAQLAQFAALQVELEAAVADIRPLATRKEQALLVLERYRQISGAVFAALDQKPTSHILWKLLYPEFARPTKVSRILADG